MKSLTLFTAFFVVYLVPSTTADKPGCNKDGKICPDGSFVGRLLPDCEFAPCPCAVECTKKKKCPQPRCIPGYPCPSFICVDGQCVKEEQPRCESDSQCPQPRCAAGSFCPSFKCVDGQCIIKEPEPECTDDKSCPQPRCSSESQFCPQNICVDGTCVPEENVPTCNEDRHCPQFVCKTKLKEEEELAKAEDRTFLKIDRWTCRRKKSGSLCGRHRRSRSGRRTIFEEVVYDVQIAAGGFCPKYSCLEGQCVLEEDPPVCPQDVKTCPDGSTVSRSGPDCEFEECNKECNATFDCPQPDCLPGTSCPHNICPRVENPQCVKKGAEDACKVDLDCIQPKCQPDTFCPANVCVEGDCVPETEKPVCADDTQCPQTSCKEGGHCSSFSCVEGQCVQEKTMICRQKDLQRCWDGSMVSRSGPDCTFDCPDQCKNNRQCPQVSCIPGVSCPPFVCVDGQCVREEEEKPVCPEDVKQCPDGSYVGRSGPKCAFKPCPSECKEDRHCPQVACLPGVPCPPFECVDGQCVQDDKPECKEDKQCPQVGCEKGKPCPSFSCKDGKCVREVLCTQDVQQCPDGSWVGRSGSDCEFDPCPRTGPVINKTEPPKSGGDPHFRTWSGIKFDYHGECDLVLLDHPQFANVGLRIHIRTTRIKYFSFIEAVVVQIGDDVLEFANDVDNFWINGKLVGKKRKHQDTMLGGYVVRRDTKALSIRMDHDHYGQHKAAHIDLYHQKSGFPTVKVDTKESNVFEGSKGLLGDYATGRMLGRDGTTEITDPTEFALEWQVSENEPMLFNMARFPQAPAKCVPPSQVLGKRLGDSHMKKMAEEACFAWGEDKDECIFDVMATRDVSTVG